MYKKYKYISKNPENKQLFKNPYIGSALIVLFCTFYGITAQLVFSTSELLFFTSSVLFALTVYYIRNTAKQKPKYQKGLTGNPFLIFSLVLIYLLVFGMCAFFQLNGIQLLLFMSSYALTIFIFTSPVFYVTEPQIKTENAPLSQNTGSFFAEKNPCIINSQDLSWLIRELNESVSGIIGFTELTLKRDYTDNEREYMLRNIYQKALSMSHAVNKVSALYPDSPCKPKDIHEVVDLLADENFI